MNKQLLVLSLIIMLFALAVPTEMQAEETEFSEAHREGRHRVLINNELFTELVYDQSEAYGPIPRPFLYPIIGPTGVNMTRHYPMRDDAEGEARDHPHHRSLWFAHGSVNSVDFWHKGANSGTIVHSDDGFNGKSLDGVNGNWISFGNGEAWMGPDGKTHLRCGTRYIIRVLDDGSRVIDIWRNHRVGEDVDRVTFGDTKEGTMAIRLHPALRLKGEVATGQCINSEGDRDGDCWGKRAKWVAYWGVIDGQSCGVAVFDHPTNLRHPTWWHARDYGLVAANPFGIHDFERRPEGTGDYTLEAGETLDLYYRFVFFAGSAEQAGIAETYDAWVEQTMPGRPGPDAEASDQDLEANREEPTDE